jgi:hypothetical protein
MQANIAAACECEDIAVSLLGNLGLATPRGSDAAGT